MLVLGQSQPRNSKSMTQLDSTSPQRTCLIGRCKDMMSRMDPMRARKWQDEVAGTSLVTRKFSSRIFCWEELHKSQEGESKNTKEKPWLLQFGASAKGLSPAFYSHKGTYWGEPVNQQCTFHGRIHDSIHGRSQRCNNTDSPNSNVPCEHWIKSCTSRVLFLKLFRVQSVWWIQLYHFSGILPEKEVFSDSGSDESCK